MFSSYRATCPSSPGELGQGTWTTAGCRVTSSLSITPRFQAGNPVCLAPAETRTWTRTWTRNLDKFYHVFSSYRATCPSSPGELGQGTWTTAGCRVTSSLSITPRSRFRVPLSLEGVSQMDSILPERLPALVRPAFDLVLRRIRSLKRCVQACVRPSMCLVRFPLPCLSPKEIVNLEDQIHLILTQETKHLLKIKSIARRTHCTAPV